MSSATSRARSHCRALTAVAVAAGLFAAPLTARGDLIGPPGDPARKEKITGIVTADGGLALLIGGVVMLGLESTQSYDLSTKNDLILAGGLCTAFGGAATLVGAIIWVLARKRSTEWQQQREGSARLEPAAGGLRLRF